MMGWVQGSKPEHDGDHSMEMNSVWELGWEGGAAGEKSRVTGNGHPTQKPFELFARPMRECLSIDVARKLMSDDVPERLAWLMATRGVPDHIRGDDGPEFRRGWGSSARRRSSSSPAAVGERYVESINGKLRDELLYRESFETPLVRVRSPAALDPPRVGIA